SEGPSYAPRSPADAASVVSTFDPRSLRRRPNMSGTLLHEAGVPAARSVSAAAPRGVVELVHFDEVDEFDTLDEQLRDAVASAEFDGALGVVVDQAHLDLSTVARVDRPGSVHDGQAELGGEARTGVDQADRAHGQRDSDAGADERPLPRGKGHVDRRAQVHTGITGVGTSGHGELRIEPAQRYRGKIGHVVRDYSRAGPPHRGDYPYGVSRSSRTSPTTPPTADAPTFSERMWVPWWWWPIGLGVAALLAAELHMGAPGMYAWLPYVL